MGAEAAVNAVYANKIAAIDGRGRARRVRPQPRARSTSEDIDIVRLASELVVDAMVEPEDLRAELIAGSRGGKDRRSRAGGTASPGLSRLSSRRSASGG